MATSRGGKRTEVPVRVAIIAAIASILAALITAGATLHVENIKLAEVSRERDDNARKAAEYEQRYESAPEAFTAELGRQIYNTPYKVERHYESGAEKVANAEQIIAGACAIVASRNGLRCSLEAIGSRLDSQIDELQAELSKPNPDPVRIAGILQVLRLKWPAKTKEIKLAVRKVLTEMGLVPVG